MNCECMRCGRLHQPLGRPPWALSHADLCHLSRQFQTDYRTAQDQRINDWLKRLVAQAEAVDAARAGCEAIEPSQPTSSRRTETGE